MLLAAALPESKGEVLEVGASSGVISLLYQERFPTTPTFPLEISPLFRECLARNKHFHNLNDFHPIIGDILNPPFQKKFQLIFSNPPFFNPKNGKFPKDPLFFNTRFYGGDFKIGPFFQKVNSLLIPGGSLWLILAIHFENPFIQAAKDSGFIPYLAGTLWSNPLQKKGWKIFQFIRESSHLHPTLTQREPCCLTLNLLDGSLSPWYQHFNSHPGPLAPLDTLKNDIFQSKS